MTLDEAMARLEGTRDGHIGNADSIRRMAEEYRLSANEADDRLLRSQHFEASSRLFGDARALDLDAEAIELVLVALRG